MVAPVWTNNAIVCPASVSRQPESAYVNMVTWTRTDAMYTGSTPLEVSADVNASAWAEHQTTLAKVRTLGINWDGEDSVPPSFPIWSRANVFLNVLRMREMFPPTKIAVSPDGLIAFEWYEDDVFLRAEVADSDQVEWMFSSSPGSPTEFKTETVAELTAPEQGQVWQPAEVDAPAYASTH